LRRALAKTLDEGKLMIVLGVHAGHDSSAAIIKDGTIIADVQEERFNRQKQNLSWR
jgi:predicted NodU family carbamoyl transferase